MKLKGYNWDEIEIFYKDRDDQNLVELVKYIKSSGLSKRLYGTTFLNYLIISVYNPIEWGKETLHILFDPDKKLWDFEYFAVPIPNLPGEFKRTYSEGKGIEKFQNFIKMTNW